MIRQRLISFAIIFIITFVILEITGMAYYTLREGKYFSAQELFEDDNLIIRDLEDFDCLAYEYLIAHPFLGSLYWNNPKCYNQRFNQYGMWGEPPPAEDDTSSFDILVVGGSVARSFTNEIEATALERVLNEYYKLGENQQFRTYCFAMDAAQHPYQSIATLMHGDGCDAVISIEGFNEHYAILTDPETKRRIELPSVNFDVSNGFQKNSLLTHLLLEMISTGRIIIIKSRILYHSHAVYLSFDLLKRLHNELVYRSSHKMTTFHKMLSLPEAIDWSDERIIEWRYEKLKAYQKSLGSTARSQQMQSAIFLQPVPQLQKELTEVELELTEHADYRHVMRRFNDIADELCAEGEVVYALHDLFEDVKGQIYGDHCHFITDSTGKNPGNELMAEAIAQLIAKEWGFELKDSSRVPPFKPVNYRNCTGENASQLELTPNSN